MKKTLAIGSAVGLVAAAVLLNTSPAPRQLWLQWDALPGGPSYEVWHSASPAGPFTLWQTVTTNRIAIGGQSAEFFKVRSKDPQTGLVSPWATVK